MQILKEIKKMSRPRFLENLGCEVFFFFQFFFFFILVGVFGFCSELKPFFERITEKKFLVEI